MIFVVILTVSNIDTEKQETENLCFITETVPRFVILFSFIYFSFEKNYLTRIRESMNITNILARP